MKYLKLSLLSVSLAALMLGCGTESDEDPLVPEIVSIEIDGSDQNGSIHSIFIDGDTTQLTGIISYSDGTSSTADFQLDWESNDSNVITVSGLGVVTAVANQGTAAISASYRDKIFTIIDKNITIIPLTELNISTDSALLTITKEGTNLFHGDTNDSGPHQLYANGLFSDGNITSSAITSHIDWSSSDTNVSLVSGTGLLTLLFDKNASVDINISVYNEVNATLDLNVTVP